MLAKPRHVRPLMPAPTCDVASRPHSVPCTGQPTGPLRPSLARGPFSPRQNEIACRCRRWPRADNPCFGGKTPIRIKSMDVIDRTRLHVSRILTLAQRCRDARHHCRRDAPDMTRSSTVNVAAENGDDSPGVLQSPAQPRHYLRCFEVERVRPHHDLKRRMVSENRNRLGGLGIDQVNQTSDPLGAKVTLVAA